MSMGLHSTIAGVCRVAMLLAGLALFAGVCLTVRAHARAERWMLDVGATMMRYAPLVKADGDRQSDPMRLRLNGASFLVSHGATTTAARDVLDHFAAKCKRANHGLMGNWGNPPAAMLDGVFRAERAGQGVVACFEPRDRSGEPVIDSLGERLGAVLRSGDLSELGDVRYVRVDRGASRTVFLAIWTEGPLPLREMFPEHGDVPGGDPDGAPRPERSRRMLSIEPAEHGERMNVYTVQAQSADELARSYRRQLIGSGFRLLEADQAAGNSRFVVGSDGRTLVTASVTTRDAAAGGASMTLVTRPD